MVAEKRIYSTTALQNCYRALRSARWSVRLDALPPLTEWAFPAQGL